MANIAIIGTGPAGGLAALALAQAGHEVALIGPAFNVHDKRTAAIMAPGLRLLAELGIDIASDDQTAPLKIMRIIDGTKRLLRAPTVNFHAHEVGEEAFGRNVPNAALNSMIVVKLAETTVRVIYSQVTNISELPHGVELQLDNGETLTCEAIVGADGQNSLSRSVAGIKTRETT